MTDKAKENLEKAKAAEKAKRPPKDNSDRPSKGMGGQIHDTKKPRGLKP